MSGEKSQPYLTALQSIRDSFASSLYSEHTARVMLRSLGLSHDDIAEEIEQIRNEIAARDM